MWGALGNDEKPEIPGLASVSTRSGVTAGKSPPFGRIRKRSLGGSGSVGVSGARLGYQTHMAIKQAAVKRVKNAAKGRLAGDSPSKFGALVPALIVGIGGTAVTYKLLRS